MLRNEKEYKLELNKNTYRAIKTLSNPQNIDIEKFIKDCIEDYKLFMQEDNLFYSKSLLVRMQEYEKKREKNRENGKLGGRPKTEKKANGFENKTEKNQSKVKENKVKESKVKENNNVSDSCVDGLQDVNDSCVDDLQPIINFYNNNIGTITPYGLEILEEYAKEMQIDLIILAMKKAVEANKRTIQYIKGILNNWNKAGIKTLAEAENESLKYKKYQESTIAEEEFLNAD